jgi:hypothetical protein
MKDAMNINPETLAEDSDEERAERNRRTGARGNGLTVHCTPNLAEPEVTEVQHRVVCLTKPYPSCAVCHHRDFTLVFNITPGARYERILCPRWAGATDRIAGKKPEYVVAEAATCENQPFEFCPSCPSIDELKKLSIDKTKDGWYSRWKRFMEEPDDG